MKYKGMSYFYDKLGSCHHCATQGIIYIRIGYNQIGLCKDCKEDLCKILREFDI